MTRNDFIKRVIRVGLLGVISFVVFSLRNRIIRGEYCSVCPENGKCPGRKVCTKY